MSAAPYFWIQTVSDALIETSVIPLWGSPPPFPWDDFIKDLQVKLDCDGLKIEVRNVATKEKDLIFEGLGSSPKILPIHATPLDKTLFWAMSQEDCRRLTATLLSKSTKDPSGFSDEDFTHGFYKYLSLEILETLSALASWGDLTWALAPEDAFPQESALYLDIQITVNKQNFLGRLLCPSSFHTSFKKHFAHTKLDITEHPQAHTLSVPISITAGSAHLSFQEWESVQVGDFIKLEHCLFDPQSRKGTLDITVGSTLLFQARLKEGKLKILDYAYFSEEKRVMDEPTDETPIDDFDDFIDEEEEGAPEHLWSEHKEQAPLREALEASAIPVTLTVEVGKLEMSLAKLLELAPGNTLELTTRPEDGVRITVQGKCVAKAELVKLGDVLGIKILQRGR